MANHKAKIVEFGKFLIIECTNTELWIATGGVGVCDYCGRPSDRGYYIAVLNQWFCPDCFEKWKEGAVWYPDDARVEQKNFDFYAPRFGLKCQ